MTNLTAGSPKAIVYVFFQFVDEVLHAFDFAVGNMEWRWRFCQWCHRHDNERDRDWRLDATVDRLVSDLPVACKLLEEQGHVNLAFQIRSACNNLHYWQERGGLVPLISAYYSVYYGDG